MPSIPKPNNWKEWHTLFLTRDPKPPLLPKTLWKPELFSVISELDASPLAIACLHLWNDDLEHAHVIAQTVEAPDYNYLHAVLHRREGDFSNSKYWYREAGENHPVIKQMKAIHQVWDPFSFVEACQELKHPAPLLQLQADEMALLLKHCTLK